MKIIFIDGVCSLCNGFVRFVNRYDKKNHFVFSSIQGVKFQTLYQKEKYSIESIVFYDSFTQNTYIKSEAVKKIFKELNIFFKFLSIFSNIFPVTFLNRIYDIVAKYRFSIFGKTKMCSYEDKLPKEKYLQ